MYFEELVKYLGTIVVILVSFGMFACIARPIMRGILKEVSAYHAAEEKRAMSMIANLLGGFVAVFNAMTNREAKELDTKTVMEFMKETTDGN